MARFRPTSWGGKKTPMSAFTLAAGRRYNGLVRIKDKYVSPVGSFNGQPQRASVLGVCGDAQVQRDAKT